MNAIPPVSPAPRSSDAVQSEATESAAQAPSAGGDFARALSDAGGKPVRKHAAVKQHGAPGGSPLPSPGNQSPLAPAAPPMTQLQGAAQLSNGTAPVAAAAGAITGTGAGTGSGAAVDNGAAQPGAGPKSAGIPILEDVAVVLAGAAPVTATPPAASASPAPDIALTAKDNHGAAPPAAAVSPGAKSGVPTTPAPTARPAVASTAADSGAKPDAAGAGKAQIAAATSGPTSTDGSAAVNGPLATGTAAADAAAQAVIASAAARDTNSSPDPSAPADDLATPDTGAPAQGVAAANVAAAQPVPIVAAAHATALATAAGAAATAASFAQAMIASADAGAADKRHDNNTDGSSTGISNDGSAGAAQLLSSNSSTDAAPVATFKVAAGLDTPDFGQGLADRVSMMVDSNLTSAKLQVNPPALGPIEVRIALQGGHAQVWMSSHSAVTRDALESSAPKLREMLGAQGFGQVSVDISQRSFQERSPQPQAYEPLPALSGLPGIAPTSLSMAHSPSGLLDAYA